MAISSITDPNTKANKLAKIAMARNAPTITPATQKPVSQPKPQIGYGLEDARMNQKRYSPATTQEPVKDRTVTVPEVNQGVYTAPDYSMIDGLDNDGLQSFVDSMMLKQSKGEQLSDQEILNLTKASRNLSNPQQTYINPYNQLIADTQALRQKELTFAEEQAQSIYDRDKQAVEERYAGEIAQQERAGRRTMDTVKGALSFSGFGRSTYAAEKQAEVQEIVQANISTLTAQKNAEIQKLEAARRGASEEVLANYDNYINQLEAKSKEYQNTMTQAMNEYNAQNTANYQEKINNILELSMQFEESQVPLTEEEMAMVESYATLAIDDEGNINNAFLENIPSKMLGPVLAQAAQLKGAIPQKQEAPDTIKGPNDSIFAWNADKGVFEQVIAGEKKTSDKTVTVEDADGNKIVMQYNPDTNRYDIPVGPRQRTENDVPINDAIAIALEKCKDGAQCGKFVNDVLEASGMGRLVGNSYESKVNAINTIGEANSFEQIGEGSIFAYPVSGSSYGHIGIVTGVNEDGTINIMDFNYNNDEQKRERTNVDPGEILNKGGSLSLPIITENTVGPALKQDLSPVAQMVIDGEIKASQIKDNSRNDKEAQQIMQEVIDYREKNPNPTVKEESVRMVNLIEELKDIGRRKRLRGGSTDARFIGGLIGAIDSNAVDMKSTFDYIKDTLTAENLISMKEQGATFGALSNEELRLIERSASRLRLDMGNEEWKKELDYIASMFDKGMDLTNTSTTQEKQVVARGTGDDGKQYVKYSDGTVALAE